MRFLASPKLFQTNLTQDWGGPTLELFRYIGVADSPYLRRHQDG